MNRENDEKYYTQKRREMVDLIANYPASHRVGDHRVLNAMSKVPRHLFVPDYLKNQAYADGPLPIGHNQTISQPYIVGYMTQILELKETDKVLEIGTGSGYQAAILAEVVTKGQVYTIDIVKSLAETAKKLLFELGYKNITVKHGNGYEGWDEYAPFDAIIVTCAPDNVPSALVDQLKIGGRMAIPVGDVIRGLWGAQELVMLKKTDNGLVRQKEFDVRFVPMVR